jgi:hypothetical protein
MPNLKRRDSDKLGEGTGKYNMCPMWNTHVDLEETLATILAQNAKQLEILSAWDTLKNTAKVFEWLGKFLWAFIKVCSAIGVIIGSGWACLKYLAKVI